MPKKKTRPELDLYSIDMDKLFGDLIRERSLYAVLHSLSNACRARAIKVSEPLTDDTHGSVRPLIEDESDFFQQAADNIELAQGMLESEWGDRAPCCADNDFWRFQARMGGAARDNLKALVARVNDPNASHEERRKAALTLRDEAAETPWFNRETGEVSLEIRAFFYAAASVIADPGSPAKERQHAIGALQQFLEA